MKLSIISSTLILALSSSVCSSAVKNKTKTKEGMNTKAILVTVLGTLAVAGAGIYFLSGDQDNSEYDNTLPKQITSDDSETEEKTYTEKTGDNQVEAGQAGAESNIKVESTTGPSSYNPSYIPSCSKVLTYFTGFLIGFTGAFMIDKVGRPMHQ